MSKRGKPKRFSVMMAAANIELAMREAEQVYHETGLTPRELLEQRDALDFYSSNIALELAELKEQRAELLEALEGFALIAEHDIGTDESDGDDYRPMQRHNVAPRVTVGHLRRALAAIAKARGGAE